MSAPIVLKTVTNHDIVRLTERTMDATSALKEARVALHSALSALAEADGKLQRNQGHMAAILEFAPRQKPADKPDEAA